MRSLIPILWLAAALAGPAPEEVALRAADASVAGGALSKRYECININGSTAEPLFVSQETASILVTIDAAATLPITHAPAAVPPYRLVRLRRAGGEWRVESVSLPEDDVAALVASARDASARAAILGECERFVTPELARRISERADVLDAQSDSDHADDLAATARAIAADWGDRGEEARAMWVLGKTLDTRDRIPEARRTYEQAYELAKQAGDDRLIAASLAGIARERIRLGDSGVRDAVEQALQIATRLGDDRIAAMATLSLGILVERGGEFSKAQQLYAEAVRRAERAGDRVETARILSQTGSTYAAMNDGLLAYDFIHRGLEAYREAHNVRGVIRTLRNMADMEGADRRFADAEKHLREVEKLLETYPNPRTSSYVSATRANIAALTHDLEAGEKASVIGLRLAKETGNEHLQTIFMHHIAGIRLDQKRYEEAAALALEAAERARTVSPDRDTYWRAMRNRGRALEAMGRNDQARASFRDAIAAIEQSRSGISVPTTERMKFFSDKATPYVEMFRTYIAGDPAEAVSWIERARARTLLEFLGQGGRKKSMRSLTPEERTAEAAAEKKIVDLNVALRDEHARASSDAERISRLEQSLAEARNERSLLLRRLYSAHPELAVSRGDMPLPSIGEIRRMIPADGAVLEYATVPEGVWLVVLTRDAPPRIHRLATNEADLHDLAQHFVKQVASRDLQFRATSHKLYDLLIRPAAAELRGKKRIGIVPEWQLWPLPFQALLDEQNHYVIEKRTIFYAPSVAYLVYEQRIRRPRAHPVPEVLAFGNPEISPSTEQKARATFRDESFGALPEAEQEARSLASIYGPRRTTVRVGKAATETALKESVGRYRIVHLAAHGVYDNDDPMYSHLVLARTPDDPNDGLLEAREIVDLDLDSDLVVLSACESGRGPEWSGDAIAGFSWALLAAGCKTGVLAQVKIASASTRDLMVSFHHHFAQQPAPKRSAAAALRLADTQMIRDGARSHPYYWAPFIAVGSAW